ncbi:MAG: DUF362 domain-containing protein [Armatimonadota bacterium]|nr:DUF362 domain-containing protein [Armatimonadota bacterium]MCX7776827.1 DUF362 domain-containing protein [Armatimonadota bacterium]MDW8024622.1 DUF362 domain-containing protein [Armatimonadota bacterium]
MRQVQVYNSGRMGVSAFQGVTLGVEKAVVLIQRQPKGQNKNKLGEQVTRRQFILTLCGTCATTVAMTSCGRQREVTDAAAKSEPEGKASRSAIGGSIGQEKRQRIVVVRNKRYVANGKITVEDARRMLQRGITELTGDETAKAAWLRIFEPEDIVGIKVNCLAGPKMSSHVEVANAIAFELMGVGVKGKHIIIWDRLNRELESAGYRVTLSSEPICIGTDTDGVGYEDEIYEVGNVGSQLSRIVTRVCNALINVPVVKDHGVVGYTGALKNWLGAVHNPNKYHDDGGDPHIAELNALHEIRSRQRLIICDALDVQYHGGPGFKPQFVVRHGALIISTDPVAVDVYCWKLVERYRKAKGLQSLESEGRKPKYILTAANEPLKLGIADEAKLQVIEIEV